MNIRLLLALFLLKTALSTGQTNCATAYLYESNIRAITERGTSIWVGTDLGLVEIDRATKAVLNRYDRNNSVIDGPVTALSVGSDGTLLIGTNTFWRTNITSFWKKELDAGAEIRDIHVQGDSLVWVSTPVGLWRLGKVVGGEFFTKSNSQLPNNWVAIQIGRAGFIDDAHFTKAVLEKCVVSCRTADGRQRGHDRRSDYDGGRRRGDKWWLSGTG